jgi:hypothetical protein
VVSEEKTFLESTNPKQEVPLGDMFVIGRDG